METGEGDVLAERTDPRAAFAGHDLDTPWDPLHGMYFASYAMWSYLTAPFSLALPGVQLWDIDRSEEHTSELQSLMRISYAVFCLKKKYNKPSKSNNHCYAI